MTTRQKKPTTKPENRQPNLTRQAFNDIRRMIFLNEFKPGQKVAYRHMAKRLGMSLTPVVQALKHMEFMGLVRHEPNRGFFVEQITPAEIDEAYALREMLELSLMPEVVAQIGDAGLKRVGQALAEYLDASRKGSLKLRLAKDINFHMTIAEITERELTIRMLRQLFDFLYLRFGQELIFSRPQDNAEREHQAIYDAIAAGRTNTAQEAMRHHIHSIRSNALEGIKNRLEEVAQIEI